MNSTKLTSYVLLLLLPVLFTACLKDSATRTYTMYKPVFKSKAEVFAHVASSPSQKTINAGKIYLHGNYIFLNDVDKGVHVIDNTNPSAPKKLAFINIPGNADIAVKGNTLYADIYNDLLAIDISDPLHSKITKSLSNVFPNRSYVNGIRVPEDSYIVDWIKKDTTVDADHFLDNNCPNCLLYSSNSALATASVSMGGSMARFAVVNDYLYAVSTFSITSILVNNPSDPIVSQTNPFGSNIETIFPFKDKLFIGSASGMHVLSINKPATPTYLSSFQHVTSCDPVVANNDYAYVTLRSGRTCGGSFPDQLQILNIADIAHPSLLKSYQLSNPYGLGLDANLLWVCDGKAGLKLYELTSPHDIKLLHTITGIEAYDVILNNKKMIVTAKEGLIQYDYSDLNNIRRLSVITTSNF